jgi:hypothetical protein
VQVRPSFLTPFNQGVGKAFNTGLAAALEMGADIMVNIGCRWSIFPCGYPLLIAPNREEKADFVSETASLSKWRISAPDYMSKSNFGETNAWLIWLVLSQANVMMTSPAVLGLTPKKL